MLKDSWVDKIEDEDFISADDINDIAQSVIDLENSFEAYDKDIMELLGSDKT